MPLIIISGYPSSGKTHRSRQIVSYISARIANPVSSSSDSAPPDPSPSSSSSSTTTTTTPTTKPTTTRRLRVHHISDHTLHLPRTVYATARAEKDARASLYSAVKRALSADDVVVLDSGNYIKGWRYQLHCEAKALATPCCVVHVGPKDGTSQGAKSVNGERLARVARDDAGRDAEEEHKGARIGGDGEEDPYDATVWEELVYRFEEPNPMARWDSPLFSVPWDDAEPPCALIWEEVVKGKRGKVKMNLATVLAPATAPDQLYILDRTTQIILAQIQTYQRDHAGEAGGRVAIDLSAASSQTTANTQPGSAKRGTELELPPTSLSTPYLQRLRRQFITLQRTAAGGAGMIGGQRGLEAERVGEVFVDWLRDQFWAKD